MAEQLNLLKKLCLAFGPSGCEGNVTDIIKEELAGLCELTSGRDGNLSALYRGNGYSDKRLMFSAHTDEVGFMVTHIDDDGYIRFCALGGIDPRVVCGRKVTIGDESRKITGIVSSKAIHQQSDTERRESTPFDKMYIDIGANNKEEAEKLVRAGDFITFDCDFVYFGDNMLRSKAIDDRFGCAVLIDVIKTLAAEDYRPDFNIYFAFTAREEVGKAGAITAAYKIKPEIAVVLEATAIADIPDVPENATVAKTGEGGVITLADNGTVYDRALINFALETAKKHDIKCQLKRYISGGNDAAHIQRSGEGARVLAVSAPCRYIHTPSNVINTADYFSVRELIINIIKDITL